MQKIILTGAIVALCATAYADKAAPTRYRYAHEINTGLNTGAASADPQRTLLPTAGPESTTASATPVRRTAPGRGPAKASLSGASFMGWHSGTAEDPGGWYSLDTDGTYKMLWSSMVSDYGVKLLNGWIKDGKLCGLGSMAIGGLVMYYNYLEFDVQTGSGLTETSIGANNTIDMANYYLSSVYVPSEDRIYGYSYGDSDCKGFKFSSSPATDIADVTTIKMLEDYTERTCALCYNVEEDKFFGVSYNGDFVSIDRQGNQTVIFRLPLETLRTDTSALIYSPLDGCYIFCAYYYDYATQLYHIYPDKKEVVFIRNFPTDNQFTFMLDPASKYDPKAPGRPELIENGFAQGALEGNLHYRLPAVKGDGSALAGDLQWTLYIDNSPYKNGTAPAGSEVDIPLSDMTQGRHVVRLACSAGGAEGLSCAMPVYFGNGMPFIPENVTLTETKVTWDPVTRAEYDAYLDLESLEYEVYINDEYQGTTSATEYNVTLDPTKTVSVYHAQVLAKCNGVKSDKGVSGKLIYGAPLPLPYTIVPTQEQADLCHIINADGGPSYGVWDFSPARWHEPVFFSGWSNDPCDDWLILPPVDCSDISHAFRVTFDAICGGTTGKDERFEVWCGNAPTVEAMTTKIIPETSVSEFITAGWETFSNMFVPRQAGPCYVAIRSVSPPEQYSLLVRNIRIEATDEVADVPAVPTGVEVVSKSDAELYALVKFTLPEQTIAGNPIPEDADVKAVLKVRENIVELPGAPGQTVTLQVPTFQGMNRIEAMCSMNGQYGQAATTNLFTGTIRPGYVENFTSEVTEDNLGIRLRWTVPTEGLETEEGYYSPAGMHYYLYELVTDEYGDTDWEQKLDLGDVNEYTYTIPSGSRLTSKTIAIAAANNGGVSIALTYTSKAIGKPYDKIKETFRDGRYNYGPMRLIVPGPEYKDASWQLVLPEEVNSDYWSAKVPYAMIGFTESETGGRARLGLPKVSSVGVDRAVLGLTLWTGKPCGDVSVYAIAYDNQTRPELIYTVPALDNGWQTVQVELPEKYQNQPWVELAVDTYLDSYYTYTLMGGYYFCPLSESGVDTTLAAQASVSAGPGAVTVTGVTDDISVYTVDGLCVARRQSDGSSTRIELPSGIYIVNAGTLNTKLVVK